VAIIGNKSQQFRYVYSNGFGIQTGGSEIVLSFGFKDNPQAPDEEITNEVAVVMLPTTLKFLSESLRKLVDLFEKTSGAEIPFDSAKLAPLEKAILDATSPTASPPLS
jgi:hypothetical protein